MEIWLISILWGIMSLLVMIQYAPLCKDLPNGDKLTVGLIFLVGGPFFAIANVLEALLDCYLPEGWDDNESNFK